MGFRDKLPKDVKRTKRSGREYIDELNTNGRFFRHILSERRWQDGLLKSLDPAIDEYGQRRKPLPPPEDGDDEDSDVEEVERLDSRWQERYSLKERSGLTWDRDGRPSVHGYLVENKRVIALDYPRVYFPTWFTDEDFRDFRVYHRRFGWTRSWRVYLQSAMDNWPAPGSPILPPIQRPAEKVKPTLSRRTMPPPLELKREQRIDDGGIPYHSDCPVDPAWCGYVAELRRERPEDTKLIDWASMDPFDRNSLKAILLRRDTVLMDGEVIAHAHAPLKHEYEIAAELLDKFEKGNMPVDPVDQLAWEAKRAVEGKRERACAATRERLRLAEDEERYDELDELEERLAWVVQRRKQGRQRRTEPEEPVRCRPCFWHAPSAREINARLEAGCARAAQESTIIPPHARPTPIWMRHPDTLPVPPNWTHASVTPDMFPWKISVDELSVEKAPAAPGGDQEPEQADEEEHLEGENEGDRENEAEYEEYEEDYVEADSEETAETDDLGEEWYAQYEMPMEPKCRCGVYGCPQDMTTQLLAFPGLNLLHAGQR